MEEMKMQNNITELVFILDESGSMAGLTADTIGGFNAMIEKQKKLDGKVYVSTYLFSNDFKLVHDRVDISEIRPMTDDDYVPHGCTALMDTLGSAIRHIAGIHRYARPEDVPEHTIFVITTDGMENASRRYSAEEIRRKISHEQEKYGWEFLFLAANIDAIETAGRYGIRPERAANYRNDSEGYETMCCVVSDAVSSFRQQKPLSAEWKKSLEEENK